MTEQLPTITVLGCGYVGVTTAVVLANCGYRVYAIEPLPERLNILKTGRSFFFEAGVDPLIKHALETGNIIFTDTYEEAIPQSSVVFCCVGTPDNADGSSNLTYVFQAAEQAAKLMKPGTVFAQKSTVPVGTGARVEQAFAKAGADIRYVSNPEFLAESSAIKDTLWFDRIVTGSEDKAAAEQVLALYKTIEQHAESIAELAGIATPAQIPPPEYIFTARNSAELIKVSANTLLALKITFANSIAKLADKAGADVTEVMAGVGADRRIGRAFLNAGRGYGGGCFPKDVSGLIRSAEEYGVDMEIVEAMADVNASMPHYIINKAKDVLGDISGNNTLKDRKVAVLGLSFKAGTSDVRRSPAIVIANTLAEQEAVVHAYDPEAMEEAKPNLDERITLADSLKAAIQDADVIFVATDWPEFLSMDLTPFASRSKVKLLVDCMNRLDSARAITAGITYVGVGK